MPAIPLAPFAPDNASVDTAVCRVARNCVPSADGYAPYLAPVPISLALPDDCRGAVAVVSPRYRTWAYYAGTGTKLFRFNTGTTAWDEISKPGASYGMPDGDSWQWALYGARLIAVHLGAVPQVLDIDRDRTFRDLGGNPPRARAIGIVNEFVILAGLIDQPEAIQWSELGDPEAWPVGQRSEDRLGDRQAFAEGGAVTGFFGGEYGVVFQERCIRRMTFVQGALEVFDTTLVEDGRGLIAPWALCEVGARTFFVDVDGFHVFTGGGSAPIGANRVNRTFLERAEPLRIGQTIAVRDVYGPRVIFAYRTRAADPNRPALLDAALIYDWQLDRWSEADVAVTAGMATATPPASLDALTGTLEDQPVSFDDARYQGGIPALGFMTADNRLSLLTGLPLEATIETADAQLARPQRAFARSVRLDTDAENWRASVGVRDSLGQGVAVRYRPETAPTVERRAPCRAEGRYHRILLRIPAGTPWSYASGFEVDATASGER